MSKLAISIHNGINVTDSREVAQRTGKQHAHLMRDIQGYISILDPNPNLDSANFFVASTYKDANNQERPCYLLTKQGCEMVANKMTGEKGVLFTAEYVQAFNKMENTLPHIKSNGEELKEKEIEAKLINAKVRQANLYLKIAALNSNLPETYKQILQSKAAETLNNGQAVIPLPKVERKTYTATEIGEMLGVSSNKIGRLANENGLKSDQYGVEVWDKAKHSNKEVATFRYYEEIIPVLKKLLEG